MPYKKPYLTKRLFACAIALLSLPLSSFGAVEVLGPYLTTTTTNSGNFTFSNIPVFNTNLGTLTGVYLSLTLTTTPFLDIQNNGDSSAHFTNSNAKVNAASADLTYPTTGGPEVLTVSSMKGKIGPKSGNVGGGDLVTFNGTTQTVTSNFLVLDPGSAFEGTGAQTVPLTIHFTEGKGTFDGTTLSNLLFGGGDDLFASLSIDYLYSTCCNCVPEPSDISLVLFSLVGLALGRRFWLKRTPARA